MPDNIVTTEYAVMVKNLEKRFGDFQAVNKVSFQVKRGEIFGFLGPNGAGKSTTMRMLCGIIVPTAGKASVIGFDVFTEAEKIKANIGYMSQKFSLYEDLTVEENIDFYSGIYQIPKAEKKVRKDWVIKMSGLEEHRNSLTAILPGGWRQRLALGCALLHKPPVIFLDEPTSGVDPISRRNFWDLIYQLAAEAVTVFVTTHYMDEAEYCDRLAMIYRGELVAIGTPDELKIRYMSADILNLECSDPFKMLQTVKEIPDIKEAALFGRGLHLTVENAQTVIPVIVTALEKRKVEYTRLEKIKPSLEDVFVSIIEERDSKTGPQAVNL
jgi:ABC-2 type transport system ATP-binding protein